MTNWPYIANAVSELYDIMANKVIFVSFRGSDRPAPLDPPMCQVYVFCKALAMCSRKNR